MAKMKQHRQVDESYLDADNTPPMVWHRFTCPPEVVWNALLDAEAWTKWLPITKVTWTSEKPFGVGTTRTVEIGKMTIEEYFYGWEDGHRMAFRFERTNVPVSAGAEDYRVVEASCGCELQWWGKTSGLPIGWLVGRQMKSGLVAGMPKLEALIHEQGARFGLSQAVG